MELETKVTNYSCGTEIELIQTFENKPCYRTSIYVCKCSSFTRAFLHCLIDQIRYPDYLDVDYLDPEIEQDGLGRELDKMRADYEKLEDAIDRQRWRL